MATVGTVLAKNMSIFTGGTPAVITCQTNASLSLQTNLFSTTCKSSGAWAANQPGVKSWTASGEGNLAFDATNGWSQLFAAWTNQTAVAIVFQTGVTGDKKYSGSSYISSLELTSSGTDEAVTFSYELTGDGALTEATI
jgi:predicted secreted protein